MKTKKNTKNKRIFITWGRYGTRVASLASSVNARTFFIGEENRFNNLLLSALTYIPKSLINLYILLTVRPKVIFVTNTQWCVAFINLFYCKLFRRKLILDSHSCAFDNHYLKYPIYLSKLFARMADISIVTNAFHKKLLEKAGAESIIINDIPFEGNLHSGERIKLSDKFNILYICIFAEDEPYMEVINASVKLTNVQFYISGNYRRVGINPADNKQIVFTGFIEQSRYIKLLNSVDAIMTLTTRENTMQRGGSEAISVGKPLITSDTEMLKEYFKFGTLFVKNDSISIAEGVNELILHYDQYKREILQMRTYRKEVFESSVNEIKKHIEKE